jgi:PIN domain nuclease of toxin-antitoxin system
MRLLLDTHFVIEAVADLSHGLSEPNTLEMAMQAGEEVFASVVSLWECYIKARTGRLPLRKGIAHWPQMLATMNITLLDLEFNHIITEIGVEPRTKDPFDRLLLSTAVAEGCQLVTKDQALQFHPTAWTPFVI